jgi:hypothetical protein
MDPNAQLVVASCNGQPQDEECPIFDIVHEHTVLRAGPIPL